MTLSELLEVLGIQHNPDRDADQPIRCPFPEHDDRHASASVNLGKGLVYCHGCGSYGDLVGVLAKVNGITLAQAREQVGQQAVEAPARKRRGGYKFKLRRRPQW